MKLYKLTNTGLASIELDAEGKQQQITLNAKRLQNGQMDNRSLMTIFSIEGSVTKTTITPLQ